MKELKYENTVYTQEVWLGEFTYEITPANQQNWQNAKGNNLANARKKFAHN